MAVLGTSGLTNVILSILQAERIVSQMNREVVALNLIDIAPCGDPLTWNVKLRGRTAAGVVAETDAAPTATSHARVPATLHVGEYSDTAGVTGRAQAAAAMALNPLGIAGGQDLMADELNDAIINVSETLGNDFYAGTGATDHMAGLAIQIDSSDDNFANATSPCTSPPRSSGSSWRRIHPATCHSASRRCCTKAPSAPASASAL